MTKPRRRENAQPGHTEPTSTTWSSLAISSARWRPPAGTSYPRILRTSNQPIIRAVAGVILAFGLYALIVPALSSTILSIGYLLQEPHPVRSDFLAAGRRLANPVGLLATNLAISVLILVAGVSIYVSHQVRPRWLSSIRPGLRWGYLLLCLPAAAAVFGAVLYVADLFGPGSLPGPHPQAASYLAVIVITSPLQAAAEEFLFRGYLLQALGSLTPTPWFGIITSALIFAALHGSQNLPLFLDRFAFGLLAAILVWRTGGLEAGIAAHIINNVLAFGTAALAGTVSSLSGISTLTWGSAALDIGGFALFAVCALGLASAIKLPRKVAALSSPGMTRSLWTGDRARDQGPWRHRHHM